MLRLATVEEEEVAVLDEFAAAGGEFEFELEMVLVDWGSWPRRCWKACRSSR